MKSKVLTGQSLFDIALEHGGSVEDVFSLVSDNEKSLTEELKPGNDIDISGLGSHPKVLKYYARKDVHPATATHELQGIDFDNIPLIIY